MPKVTVIMPAYNHEGFIGESIESALSQTYTDIELLILNDGSTDGTKSVIESYAKKDNRIRFIDKPNNGGTVAALNDLIDEAEGEYIIWLSSDDLQYPYTVESLIRCFEHNPGYNIAFGGMANIDENGGELDKIVHRENKDKYYFHKRMLRWNIVSGCSVAVKRECYKRLGGFDSSYRYAHDYDMWLRLFAENDVFYIEEALTKNRVHEGQITSLGRNDADAVRVQFDFYRRSPAMERYLARIGMEYNGEALIFLIKQLGSNLIRRRLPVKKEFVYRLNKYLKNSGLSQEHKDILLAERKFFERITDESFEKSLKITENDINCAFVKLANNLKLDGMLVNREALRYHLLDNSGGECFYRKVMPHDNMLCIAEISGQELAKLKETLIYFPSSADIKNVYKIGITSHMAEHAPYREAFRKVEFKMEITLSSEIYRRIIE